MDTFHKTEDVAYFRNEQDELHRLDGPAVMFEDGTYYWFYEGTLHREDGPAVNYSSFKKWYKYGKLHRLDGPAVITTDGDEQWWIEGKEYDDPKKMPLGLFIKFLQWKFFK